MWYYCLNILKKTEKKQWKLIYLKMQTHLKVIYFQKNVMKFLQPIMMMMMVMMTTMMMMMTMTTMTIII